VIVQRAISAVLRGFGKHRRGRGNAANAGDLRGTGMPGMQLAGERAVQLERP
jgi:hypothetical protein